MFDAIDARLSAWVRRILPQAAVSFAPPGGAADGEDGVSLFLLSVEPLGTARAGRRPPLRIALHYLISVWAATPAETHRMLGELMFSALTEPGVDVEPGPVPVEVWRALGAAPRPAFRLRAIAERECPEPVAPLVTQPLTAKIGSLRPLRGVVLEANGRPARDAVVELAGGKISGRTDARGRFQLDAAPPDAAPLIATVTAGRRSFTVTLDQAGAGGTVTVQLPAGED